MPRLPDDYLQAVGQWTVSHDVLIPLNSIRLLPGWVYL